LVRATVSRTAAVPKREVTNQIRATDSVGARPRPDESPKGIAIEESVDAASTSPNMLR